jgi:hypothetical protein
MKGEDAPFIRILCSSKRQIAILKKRLKGLIDIEIILLTEFVPKKA